MTIDGIHQPEGRAFAIEVEPDRLKTLKVFVRQPSENIEGSTQTFRFIVEDRASYESDEYTATFNAPEKSK